MSFGLRKIWEYARNVLCTRGLTDTLICVEALLT